MNLYIKPIIGTGIVAFMTLNIFVATAKEASANPTITFTSVLPASGAVFYSPPGDEAGGTATITADDRACSYTSEYFWIPLTGQFGGHITFFGGTVDANNAIEPPNNHQNIQPAADRYRGEWTLTVSHVDGSPFDNNLTTFSKTGTTLFRVKANIRHDEGPMPIYPGPRDPQDG